MKSVTSFPIERTILKRKRERKEILSIVLHIVSSFSARKRRRKRRILIPHHSDAVVTSKDVHDAVSTGAESAASAVVIDAASTDVHEVSPGALDAASKDVHDAAFMDVYDAASTVVIDAIYSDVHAASSVVFDAATDVHGFLTGV